MTDSNGGVWLGDLVGGVVREHAERDDVAVIEFHGDENLAAVAVDFETAVWLADASDEIHAVIRDGGDTDRPGRLTGE